MVLFLVLFSSAIFAPQRNTIHVGVPLYSSTQFLDIDNDGDLDILVCSEGLNSSVFLENIDNSQFVDITETVEIDYSTGIRWATVADINNDGFRDLAIVGTFDEKLLKVFLNKDGNLQHHKSIYLPATLLANPIPIDFNRDSLLDFLLPTNSGIYLLTNTANEELLSKKILGISSDMLYIFNFDKKPYLDILARSDGEWFLVRDFQTSSLKLFNLGLNGAFLVPSSVSTDTVPGIFVFQPNGLVSRIFPPLNHILTGIIQLDSPLRKVLPITLNGDTIILVALDKRNTLLELSLGKFNAEAKYISGNVLDFYVVQFSPSSPPTLVFIRSDSTIVIVELSPLKTVIPEPLVSIIDFIKSEFNIYRKDVLSKHFPIISTMTPIFKGIFTLSPDSIHATWWFGGSVKVRPFTDSPTIIIPLHQKIEGYQSAKSGLLKVFPNPAVKVATIRYTVFAQSLVELTITTLTGQRVSDIERAVKEPGTYNVQIDLSDFLPGRYIVQLKLDGETYQSKLIVLR